MFHLYLNAKYYICNSRGSGNHAFGQDYGGVIKNKPARNYARTLSWADWHFSEHTYIHT